VSAGIFALAAALLGGIAGFVYAHEPARDTLAISVDAPPPSATTTIGGTVDRVESGRIVIMTESGSMDLALPSGVPVEQLESLAPEALVPGARVNVGAERTETGTIVSGIVVVDTPR
jgi:hypothetical protein